MTHQIVTTQYGKVKGTTENGVHKWKGIPYAKPPVGQWRFKAPEPPEVWEDVLDATAYGLFARSRLICCHFRILSCPASPRIACLSMYLRLTLQAKTCLSWFGFTEALFISARAVSHCMTDQNLRRRERSLSLH